MEKDKDIQADRLILILTEPEGKQPLVHVYRGNFDHVVNSFENCSAMGNSSKGRMTLVDIEYGDTNKSTIYVRKFPTELVKSKEDGYRLGDSKK